MNIKPNFNNFKRKYKNKKNQIIFHETSCKSNKIIENLINNFLIKKIALFLNLLKKERLEVVTPYLGLILIKFGNLIKKKYI